MDDQSLGRAHGAGEQFRLLHGGPFDSLQLRTGLLSPQSFHPLRRTLVLLFVTAVPLAVLAALQGVLTRGETALPLLADLPTQARFLLALPLLVLAEPLVALHTRTVAAEFEMRGLVRESERPAFHATVHQCARLRDSRLAEALLLGLAFAAAAFGESNITELARHSWRFSSSPGAERTLAGVWYEFAALPLLDFLFLRWLWRYLIWTVFLVRVAGLDLDLSPAHPDRTGGLGFVRLGQSALALIPLAASCIMAAGIGLRVLRGDAEVRHFAGLLAVYLAVVLAGLMAPLLPFTPMLLRTRRRGRLRYGALASDYTRAFDRRWRPDARAAEPSGAPLLGSPDIQSLADLGNSVDRVQAMRAVVSDARQLAALGAITLAPMAPLLLTEISLGELLKVIVRLLAG